jgi:hypothetical protein
MSNQAHCIIFYIQQNVNHLGVYVMYAEANVTGENTLWVSHFSPLFTQKNDV